MSCLAKADAYDAQSICCICEQNSGASPELLGPWMQKKEISVHYFCLLLSTNLPQNGGDNSGICGFLLRDIRAEIVAAKARLCVYCGKPSASVSCKNCKEYFHLKCGQRNSCFCIYSGDFSVYCYDCFPYNVFQKEAEKNWSSTPQICHICKNTLGKDYTPAKYLYGPCCGNGFVHRTCLQKYAMSAGYYLRCIWCRSSEFRESIKQQGVFVPDREALWETRHAYRDLHRGHKKCDMEPCHCPQGRKFESRWWRLINCSLCGAFGVHFPKCLTKPPTGDAIDFECPNCTLISNNTTAAELIDTSYYIETQRRSQDSQTPNSQQKTCNDRQLSCIEEQVCNSEASVGVELVPDALLAKKNGESETRSGGEVINIIAAIYDLQDFEALELSTKSDKNVVDALAAPGLIRESDIVERIKNTERPQCVTNVMGEAIESVLEFPKPVFTTANLPSTNCGEKNTETSNISMPATVMKEIEFYEFTADYDIKGSCKVRLDMKSERFMGKTIDDILATPGLIQESDVVERTPDIGIFKAVNKRLEKAVENMLLSKSSQELQRTLTNMPSKDPSINQPLSNSNKNNLSTAILKAVGSIDRDIFMPQQQVQQVQAVAIRSVEPAATSAIPTNHTNADLQSTNISNSRAQPMELDAIISDTETIEDTAIRETDFQELEFYEYTSDFSDIKGSCKVRLDMKSERFRGKSIDDILSNPGLLRESDVVERTADRGIFGMVDEILQKAMKDNFHLE